MIAGTHQSGHIGRKMSEETLVLLRQPVVRKVATDNERIDGRKVLDLAQNGREALLPVSRQIKMRIAEMRDRQHQCSPLVRWLPWPDR